MPDRAISFISASRMSSSNPRSTLSRRMRTVTSLPMRERAQANSTAIYPPPTITTRRGSVVHSRISFDVSARWMPGVAEGRYGQAPVATRIFPAVTVRPSDRRTAFGPATVARLSTRVTPALRSVLRYAPSSRSISLSFAALRAAKSKRGSPASQPNPFASSNSSAKREA